jgi:hypothetical protein
MKLQDRALIYHEKEKRMSSAEERLKILNMVSEGKITAQEGAQLLSALRGNERMTSAGTSGSAMETGSPRFLRVRVSDSRTGKVKVNINIPMSLLHVAVRVGARFAPDLEGLDFNEIMSIIDQGARGKIIDVSDEDDSERVEIFAE